MKYKLGAFKPRDAIILLDFLQKLRGCQVKSGNKIIIPGDVIGILPVNAFLLMFRANIGNFPGELVATQGFHVNSVWTTPSGDMRSVTADITHEDGGEDVSTQPPSPKSTQVGGDHYSKMKIQPIDFITANELGYIEGNIIKYVCRYKSKNGVEDLEKAQHYLQMLIEQETKTKE
jgi:hypothetical protein|nr:MAG TPA: nucelotide kinase [Caudoviricetes sp.]